MHICLRPLPGDSPHWVFPGCADRLPSGPPRMPVPLPGHSLLVCGAQSFPCYPLGWSALISLWPVFINHRGLPWPLGLKFLLPNIPTSCPNLGFIFSWTLTTISHTVLTLFFFLSPTLDCMPCEDRDLSELFMTTCLMPKIALSPPSPSSHPSVFLLSNIYSIATRFCVTFSFQ